MDYSLTRKEESLNEGESYPRISTRRNAGRVKSSRGHYVGIKNEAVLCLENTIATSHNSARQTRAFPM